MEALDGDYFSGALQDEYEARLVAEARDIVQGVSQEQPTVEHLRILLAWLDGATYQPDDSNEPPFWLKLCHAVIQDDKEE